MLKQRTGNVRDVLEVEREIARVRGEIEQLDAQQKQLQDRVSYATVSLTVSEERQAKLDTGTAALGTQLRNAFVEGMQNVYESAAGALLTVLRVVPVLGVLGRRAVVAAAPRRARHPRSGSADVTLTIPFVVDHSSGRRAAVAKCRKSLSRVTSGTC